MTQLRRITNQSKQAGGTFLGVVLGLIVGLVVAVGVAWYVMRAPSPFVAKNAPPQEASASAVNDAQFDPNRMLLGHAASQPVATPQPASGAASQPAANVLNGSPPIVVLPAASGVAQNNDNEDNESDNDGAASSAAVPVVPERTHAKPKPAKPRHAASAVAGVASGKPARPKPAKPARPGTTTSPATLQQSNTSGGAAPATSTNSNLGYFLQAGAYKTTSEAEQQRARLGLLGIESKLTSRNVGGVTYYRVRTGPFAKVEDADAMRQRLHDMGIETIPFKVVPRPAQ